MSEQKWVATVSSELGFTSTKRFTTQPLVLDASKWNEAMTEFWAWLAAAPGTDDIGLTKEQYDAIRERLPKAFEIAEIGSYNDAGEWEEVPR